MRSFVGAIPFFDAQMVVHAYKIVIQDGDKLLGAAEDFRELGTDLLAPALEIIRNVGTEPFAGINDLFVDKTFVNSLLPIGR